MTRYVVMAGDLVLLADHTWATLGHLQTCWHPVWLFSSAAAARCGARRYPRVDAVVLPVRAV